MTPTTSSTPPPRDARTESLKALRMKLLRLIAERESRKHNHKKPPAPE